MKKIRLQKYLAEKGIDSRRKCEKLIVHGRIKVNNHIVTQLGTQVDPKIDKIAFDNKLIQDKIKKVYLMLNKPQGYLTTSSDPFGRPTVYDLIKDVKIRLNYAGRLDYDSEGLLIFTNDGDLIYQLTHPGKKIEKVYIVKIKGIPNKISLQKIKQGLPLSTNFTTSPSQIKILKKNNDMSTIEIKINEGKKRQVKRMFSYVNHPVVYLKRIRMGFLSLGTLKRGKYRFLNSGEVAKLKQSSKY